MGNQPCYGRLAGFGHVVHGWCSPNHSMFCVLLKGEHLDYIHAVVVHVSSKGACAT